jgi:RNA-directed DNA polymerase
VSLATPEKLRKLQRALYATAKRDPVRRFHVLYDKVWREDTLAHAFALSRENGGAPGVDGVTFAQIETYGVARWLGELREEVRTGRYTPQPVRRVMSPKSGGVGQRPLGIPTIRDRVVQTAAKLVIEPIFEADFDEAAYGYRPRRSAHEAIRVVHKALDDGRTEVVDADLSQYFDTVRQDLLLGKVARRVQDAEILHLLRLMLQASGKRGVPQGGVISPLLSNIYLHEVDAMLERAKAVTRDGKSTYVEYARYADDLVILVNGQWRNGWLRRAVDRRLREELAKLDLRLNEAKSRVVDLIQGEAFGFLGFVFRRLRSAWGRWWVQVTPAVTQRTALLRKLREVFRRWDSQPVGRVIAVINPILRGWVNYFRVGHAARCLGFVKLWVEKKVRRHMMRARGRRGFGWRRWSTTWVHTTLGLFHEYRVSRARV